MGEIKKEKVLTMAEVFFSQVNAVSQLRTWLDDQMVEIVFTDGSKAYVEDDEIYHEGMIDERSEEE